MSKDKETSIFEELADILQRSFKTDSPLQHKKDCKESLVLDYVTQNLDRAGLAYAKEKIFSCRACALLAFKMSQFLKEAEKNKVNLVKLDREGFENWKNTFEKKHTYLGSINLKGRKLKVACNGIQAELSGNTRDLIVRIGKKSFAPAADAKISWPDVPDAELVYKDGTSINIHAAMKK